MSTKRPRSPFITVIATSAIVGASACKGADTPSSHPQPSATVEDITQNPPSPQPSATVEDTGLPKWDDIKSSHPEGATNPPTPILTLTRTGECLKSFEGGIGGRPKDTQRHEVGEKSYFVRIAPDLATAKHRGRVPIECPPEAKALLAPAPPRASTPKIPRNPPRPLPPKPRPRVNPPAVDPFPPTPQVSPKK